MQFQGFRKLFLKRLDLRLCQRLDGAFRGLRLILTVFFLQHQPLVQASEGVQVDLRTIDGNFHLEFLGAEEWDYDLERKEVEGKSFVELRIPNIEVRAQEQFNKIPANEVVESIFLEKVPGGSKDILTLTLKSKAVESFDYLTEKPSRLIIDLYLTKKLQQASQKTKGLGGEKKNGSVVAEASQKESRKPAADEFAIVAEKQKKDSQVSGGSNDSDAAMDNQGMAGVFDGGDPNFERFSIRDHEIREDSIVLSKENLYIPFPMLILEDTHYNEIKAQQPIYEIDPKNNPENKMARLVLTLFEKNRLSVCLKTASWFLEKYPKSEYEEIIRFMIGDIYYKRWERDGTRANYEYSMQAYREALTKFPKSILATRSLFLIGYSQYAYKDYFGSLRTFQRIVAEFKPSELRDNANLAVARSLLKLSQFDEAVATYENIEKNGFAEARRMQAAYLKGDVFYTTKDYPKASEAYQSALAKFGKGASRYPNAFYNMAESLFWQKKFKESLLAYREFLTRFPREGHAPFAMTRVGETLEILGADPRRFIGAFLETFFRYGGAEGAAVARMRMLSSRMGDMKEKEAEKAIQEINSISTSVALPQIDLFAAILVAEGLSRRKNYERAIDGLLKWYQTMSSTRDVSLIKKRIVRHVNEKMEEAVLNGKFLEALKVHSRYAELWLRNSGRIDTVFNLGRAFELAGSYREADSLYRDTMNLLVGLKNSETAREQSVFEHLPSLDQVYLRLSRVKKEAGEINKAYDYLKEIKEPQKLSEEQQVERMEIAVDLLKLKGDTQTAKIYLKDLIDNWKGIPLKVSGLRLKLAELEFADKNFSRAEALLKTNLEDFQDSQKIPSEGHMNSLKMLSDILAAGNRTKENESLLGKLLEDYQDSSTLSSYRFRLGKIYFDAGNIQKATQVWKVLEQKKESFWWGLASNNLKDSEWKDNYKKYIQRIPAMSGMNEKGKE